MNSNPNPNFSSYFTQQSIQEFSNSGTELRNNEYKFELGPNPIDVRGSIQRELEKERIRARIIGEEILRRRVLEEEVRRELMIERELAMRGVPLLNRCENRVGFRNGFESVPFQRDPVLVNNGPVLHEIKEVNNGVVPPPPTTDKVIILAKPSVNLTDTKRKSTTPPVAEEDAVEVCKKQKTNDDWSCTLCGVTATSERALNDHLQGKKHLAKVKGTDSQRTVGFGSEPIPKLNTPEPCKPVCLPTVTTSTPTVKNSKKNRYVCEVCRIEVYSPKVFTAHNKGRKHLAKLSKIRKSIDSEAKDAAQKAVIEENNENDEVEVIAGGEVETDSDVNRLGEKVKVIETVGEKNVAVNIIDEGSVCNEGRETDDATPAENAAGDEELAVEVNTDV